MLFLITSMALTSSAIAQIDPSSAMLLNSSNRAPVRDNGLDSGRYTVKPRVESVRRDERPPTKRISLEGAQETAHETVIVEPVKTTPTASLAPAPPSRPASASASASASAAVYSDDQATETEDVYVAKVAHDDRRLTVLELSFAPGYLYNESKSTFAPRNYFLNAPVMNVDATVWVATSIGLKTSFTGSLNANITDSFDNTRNTSASDQWFAVGARSRSFFGDGPKAPTLKMGLDYREFEFKIPSDSQLRNKLSTSGVIVLVEGEIPTSGLGSWVFGAEFGPRLSHKETSNATSFQTGRDPATTSVGVHFGQRYRFDRTQSLFWKVSYSAEKTLFSGLTSIPDPVSGSPQSNVSVTSSFSMFQLGYTWSD